MKLWKSIGLAAALTLLSGFASAATSWVDWVSADTTGTSSANTVKGTLLLGSTSVDVIYTGPTRLVQLSGGIDYWTHPAGPDPYSVTGRPTGTDIIEIFGGTTDTYSIKFLTPVVDPVMALLSLGQPNDFFVTYTFDHTPTLLSSGQGFWGGCATCLTVSGNSVIGEEGHGVVQFTGVVSEITWTVPTFENWHGFTFGAAAVVPEPETYALMLVGLAAIGLVARRRKS